MNTNWFAEIRFGLALKKTVKTWWVAQLETKRGWTQERREWVWTTATLRDGEGSTGCTGEWRPRYSLQLPNRIALKGAGCPILYTFASFEYFVVFPSQKQKNPFLFQTPFDEKRKILRWHSRFPFDGVLDVLRRPVVLCVSRWGAKRASEHDNIMSPLIIALSRADSAAIVNSPNLGCRKQTK